MCTPSTRITQNVKVLQPPPAWLALAAPLPSAVMDTVLQGTRRPEAGLLGSAGRCQRDCCHRRQPTRRLAEGPSQPRCFCGNLALVR